MRQPGRSASEATNSHTTHGKHNLTNHTSIDRDTTISTTTTNNGITKRGGAPGNPAPRDHLVLVWIVKASGCRCTDGHLTSSAFTEDETNMVDCRPPLALTLSLMFGCVSAMCTV